uniref:Rho GTPase activating protein 30 n=1 Tax=Aquila chrysaetos chrysaetos TaxID=223781 RepID=A0A663EPD9_AQUCH
MGSKDIEATGFNGTAAFMEVRVQSIVVEFILTHVEQLFGDAPLRGGESLRRSLLLGGGGTGDGRKGSIKAKKWRSIFNLGRSSHEAKRKLVKAEEKDDKCGKITLRPAKSMDSLSSSFDTCPSLPAPESCPELDESLEEKLKGKEEPRGPESEGENSTKSEPTTPKAGRASLVAPGRSPKASRSRAEKCAGVHISGPFSVTVPFHITSNLSRLTRGLPCPALAQAAAGRAPPASPPLPAQCSAGDPEVPEGQGGIDPSSPSVGPQGHAVLHDWGGLQCSHHPPAHPRLQPGEPPMEQPASYLSIEECMDEEMFFMAPSGSDAEDHSGDTDSEDMFLSAHDDLSPLAASLEPLDQLPGEGTAPETLAPAPPASDGTTVPQDRSLTPGLAGPCPMEEDAPGEGEQPGDPAGAPAEEVAPGTGQPAGEGGGGEGAVDSGSGPSRTGSSTKDGLGNEAGGAGGHVGAGLVPDTSDGEVEEDGAGSGPPAPEEPGEGEAQPSPGSPPASSREEAPQEPVESLVPGSVPEALPPSAASVEGTDATPVSSPSSPSLSASAPELRSPPPEAPEPSWAEPTGELGRPEPVAVLRRDGSAPVRLAARTIRVQQARSVPVVPPKPQFAKIPPALQPWMPPQPGGSGAAAGARRAGWREGGSMSFDTAVAMAAEQQLAQAPVRRIQTYGGGEPTPAPPQGPALPEGPPEAAAAAAPQLCGGPRG